MLLTEKDLNIYTQELLPRMPENILDVHVHTWSLDFYPPEFKFPAKDCCARFGGNFTLSFFHELMKEMLPEQKVRANCFCMPDNFVNRDCVSQDIEPGDTVNFLISPDDPAELVEERIDRCGAVGVKPYWNFPAAVYNKTAAEVEIKDMLTPDQLKMLNRRKLAVTLHIPRPGRFEDPVNQRQMIELCETYPDIRFIFAHIGRAFYLKNILKSNIADFVRYPNVYFDTAMLGHEGVLRYAFDHFPAERILYGSDAPIAMLRGKSVEINDQYAYLMGEEYELGTVIYDTKHSVNFTFFLYEQLRALLNAAPTEALSGIFFDNADKLFKGIGK